MTVPSVNDHMIQARANRQHAEWLLVHRAGDVTAQQWAVTVAFYAALHGLSAHLLRNGVTVASHTARARAIGTPASDVPQAVLVAYRALEYRSRQARCLFGVFTTQDVRDLLDRDLATVAAFAGL